MTNPLSALPENVRKAIYAVYAALGLGLGATQVAYSTLDMGLPPWLKVSLAVFAFVGMAIGATAVSNMPAVTDQIHRGEVDVKKDDAGETMGNTLILVLAVVGIVLIVLLLAGAL